MVIVGFFVDSYILSFVFEPASWKKNGAKSGSSLFTLLPQNPLLFPMYLDFQERGHLL